MKELTRAEEQVMQILWEMDKAFVRDIIDEMPEPKPAYNTVSTIVRILEKKGFVDHKAYGKSHQYFPIVSKKEYTRSFGKRFMRNYFDGSFKEMVSFFAREDKLDIHELNNLLEEVRRDIDMDTDEAKS